MPTWESEDEMKMSTEKKKELQNQYKQFKPDMGIFAVINKNNGKHFLEATKNLKAKINSTQFQLKMGGHFNQALNKDLQALGPDGFEIKILEQLQYDDDGIKTDYSDDLELLKMIWVEKLTRENVQLY